MAVIITGKNIMVLGGFNKEIQLLEIVPNFTLVNVVIIIIIIIIIKTIQFTLVFKDVFLLLDVVL